MDSLSRDSLSWALAHVLRFGDTDVLPVPFEFQAIRAHQRDVVDYLAQVDLETHETRPQNRALAPKATHGFRAVAQLDPYDTLLFTAMVYEEGQRIESFRVAKEKRIACSYRLEILPDGQIFSKKNGWPDFYQRSKELDDPLLYGYVLCTDISDYYNQIYHHRIRNALETAGVNQNRSRNIERLLGTLTAKQSRGIPIGPVASALLAEVCLSDVDGFLLRKNVTHTRYVDDFRIFVPDRSSAIKALHDITEYLYTSHRLSLQGAKTHILTLAEFVERELPRPEDLETESKTAFVRNMLESATYAVPFDELDELELPPGFDFEATTSALNELFEKSLATTPINVGLARYVLRRATAIRSRTNLPMLLANLERCLSMLPDVINYLVRAYPPTAPKEVGEVLKAMLTASDYRDLPFVQAWVLHAFATIPAFLDAHQALLLADKCHPVVSDRYGALIARAHGVIDWVRERKETWANNAPWVQRAIIWAGQILPPDERRHWLGGPMKSGDHLLSVVAKAAAAPEPSPPRSSSRPLRKGSGRPAALAQEERREAG